MTLTPEQRALGRRNFLKAVAGVPALAGLGVAAATHGPVRGGPVRVGFIGLGGEGRVLLAQTDPMYAEVRALCDINPTQPAKPQPPAARIPGSSLAEIEARLVTGDGARDQLP